MNAFKRRWRVNALLFRDGDDCCFCLKPLGDDISLEHLQERAQGGGNRLDNLMLAHVACNQFVKGWSIEAKLLWRGDALLRQIERERCSPRRPSALSLLAAQATVAGPRDAERRA